MKTAAQVLLLAAGAALIVPAVAEAQCWELSYCESYGYSSNGGVYGYSRSVDYYGHYEIGVEATLSDPEWQGVGYAWEWGQFDVYAEVSSNVESSGDYKVDGEHYYWHYYWQDWYWDGSTSAVVYGEASEPEIWSIGPAGPWEAGSLVNVTVTGQGFLGKVAWACGGADWDNLFVASDGLITGDIQVSPWYNPGVCICVGAAVSMGIALFQPPPPIYLDLDRPSLTQVWAYGYPTPGTYYWTLNSSQGDNPPSMQYAPGVSQTTYPNPKQVVAPIGPGNPIPGGLRQYSVSYQDSYGRSTPAKSLKVATFGASCYVTALESDRWDSATQSCKSLFIRPNTYSGRWQDPPGLPGTNYCAAFIADVRLNGSGLAMDGTKIKYNKDNATWYTVDVWSTADGGPPVAYETVARDANQIPAWTHMSLAGIGPNGGEGFIAHDVGGAIGAYRVDVYTGFGLASGCYGWTNPIVVAACSPATAACPAKELE